MKNRLTDLNDHLFAQIERLGDEGLTAEQLELEVKRSGAVVGVADQIISNAALHLKACDHAQKHGTLSLTNNVPMLELVKK